MADGVGVFRRPPETPRPRRFAPSTPPTPGPAIKVEWEARRLPPQGEFRDWIGPDKRRRFAPLAAATRAFVRVSQRETALWRDPARGGWRAHDAPVPACRAFVRPAQRETAIWRDPQRGQGNRRYAPVPAYRAFVRVSQREIALYREPQRGATNRRYGPVPAYRAFVRPQVRETALWPTGRWVGRTRHYAPVVAPVVPFNPIARRAQYATALIRPPTFVAFARSFNFVVIVPPVEDEGPIIAYPISGATGTAGPLSGMTLTVGPIRGRAGTAGPLSGGTITASPIRGGSSTANPLGAEDEES